MRQSPPANVYVLVTEEPQSPTGINQSPIPSEDMLEDEVYCEDATSTPIDINPYEDIGSYIDLLGDKKMKNLSKTINMIKNCLIEYQNIEEVQSHRITMCSDLLRIIKRTKTASDIIGSCQLISLLQMIFYDDMEVFSACYDGLFQQLKVAKSQATATALMHACSILLFVSDTPDETLEEFMDYLTSVIASPKPTTYQLVAKAIDCWVMLKSIQAKNMILNNSLPAFASLVTNCLEITDMPIRIASARCLVFLQEMLNDSPSYTPVSPLNAIKENIQTALNEYNRYWKDSRDQDNKRIIREIARSCASTCHPEVTLKFANATVVIDRWGSVVTYFMFRQTLERGVLYHIKVNPLLAQVFGKYVLTASNTKENRFLSKETISSIKRENIRQKRNEHDRKMQAYAEMCMYDD